MLRMADQKEPETLTAHRRAQSIFLIPSYGTYHLNLKKKIAGGAIQICINHPFNGHLKNK